MNPAQSPAGVTLESFQRLIREMYFDKDQARGIPATFLWLSEEIGELAAALRETDPSEKIRITEDEFQVASQKFGRRIRGCIGVAGDDRQRRRN